MAVVVVLAAAPPPRRRPARRRRRRRRLAAAPPARRRRRRRRSPSPPPPPPSSACSSFAASAGVRFVALPPPRLISSATYDVREDWAMDEAEFALALFVLVENRGASDVRGHQVRRELDSFEGDVEDLRDGRHHQRLREPRHADEQAMSASENRGHDLLDDVGLPDDHSAELLNQLRAGLHNCVRYSLMRSVCTVGGSHSKFMAEVARLPISLQDGSLLTSAIATIVRPASNGILPCFQPACVVFFTHRAMPDPPMYFLPKLPLRLAFGRPYVSYRSRPHGPLLRWIQSPIVPAAWRRRYGLV